MIARELKSPTAVGFQLFTRVMDTMALTLGLGDAPSATLYEDTPGTIGTGEWIVFIFAMFTVNIVILNTLIAILGDSYDKVVMDRQIFET